MMMMMMIYIEKHIKHVVIPTSTPDVARSSPLQGQLPLLRSEETVPLNWQPQQWRFGRWQATFFFSGETVDFNGFNGIYMD
jgi:hypothetical protein